MPQPSSIPHSIEWKILSALRESRPLIIESHFVWVKKAPRLKNEARKIDFELRRLLFELLGILQELEFQDDLPFEDSVQTAVGQLPDLCLLLESQVNNSGITQKQDTARYPRLSALIERLSMHAGSNARFALVSNAKGTHNDRVSALFLITRVKQAHDTAACLESLNKVISRLKQTPATAISQNTSPSVLSENATLNSTTAYDEFLRQVIAVFYAMFTGFLKCDHSQHKAHELLFHLPAIGTIKSSNSDRYSLKLFLTCPSTGFQEASVELVSQIDQDLYRTPPLCRAIDNAVRMGTSLNFHVEYDGTTVDYAKCIARIPKTKLATERMFLSRPSPDNTLRKLLESGEFLPPLGNDSFDAPWVSWTERRLIATKLIVGMLISLEGCHLGCQLEKLEEGACEKRCTNPMRDHVIECWDSTKIYIMEVPNGEWHVSCNVIEKAKHTDGILLLPEIPESHENLVGPSPALTILAKTLLEICYGPIFDQVKFDPDGDYLYLWEHLNTTVKKAIQRTRDIQILPLFETARACLDFHFEYEHALTLAMQRSKHQNPSSPYVDSLAIAKDTFHRFVMQTLMATELSPLEICLEEPRKPVVSLFDDSGDWGKGTREATWAENFFNEFKIFRDSYEHGATISYDRFSQARSRRPVRVAIIDTGVDWRHGGLRSPSFSRDRCWSWLRTSSDVTDNDGHGTYCAHIFHKIAPKAEIYIAQTFSGKNFTLEEAKYIAAAIEHAVDIWKVDIISMSFGLQEPSSEKDRAEWELIIERIRKAISNASNKHVLMFAAASNDGKNQPRTFPATMQQEVICIHAADGNGNDGGINPDAEDAFNFTTLGIAIPSPRFHGHDLAYKSGTSFATPIAAGMAAVLLDFARRTTYLKDDVKNGLRTIRGTQEMFKLMSIPDGTSGKYRYVAPWLLWTANWREKRELCDEITLKINNSFKRLAYNIKFPDDT